MYVYWPEKLDVWSAICCDFEKEFNEMFVKISQIKTIKSLKKADGLVVGSAICKEITRSIEKRQNTVTNVTNVVRRLKNKIK